MERLDDNDMCLIDMMADELNGIMAEIQEDLTEHPGVHSDLGKLFTEPAPLAIMLVAIYATMDTGVRRRLDAVVERYREACA